MWPKISASPAARLSAAAGEGPLCCSAFASTDLFGKKFLIFRTSSFLRIWRMRHARTFCGCLWSRGGGSLFMVGSGWWSQFHLSLWVVADRVVVCSLLILLGSGMASLRFSPAGWVSLASSEGNAYVLLYLFLVSSDFCQVCFFMKL